MKITDSNNLYTISGQTRYSVDTSKAAGQIAEADNMQVTTAGNFVVEKGQYATLYGAVTESKYGYAAELDSVSRDYAAAMFNRDYSGAASQNMVSAMEEKYQLLKEEIEGSYEGEEREERLAELDSSFDFIMKANVTDATDLALKSTGAINKLKSTFANAYQNAVQTKSSEYVQIAYGDLSAWGDETEQISQQLNNYKELFEQFRETLQNIHTQNGATQYADSLLKSISSGLVGVQEKNTIAGERISTSDNKRIQELWTLIEKKAESYMPNTYGTDEEKYSAFLKNYSQIGNVDSRLEEILKEIENGE
ncbi:MAG: hypothetical protein ACI4ES_09550 [Roseburia sp.]